MRGVNGGQSENPKSKINKNKPGLERRGRRIKASSELSSPLKVRFSLDPLLNHSFVSIVSDSEEDVRFGSF